ncbi:MAG: hypothetical protein H6Q14_2384 [Bacteroidetes bacterium]|nr:hypothetical protein [Bacteroidota bacterium]
MEYLKFIKNPAVKAFLWRIKQGFIYFKTRERKLSFGPDNPDKRFYVICIRWTIPAGLFAVMKSVLSHIDYAIDKGMVPVVNMKDSVNGTAFNGLSSLKDSWEVLFDQPANYSPALIRNSKHVTLSSTNPCPCRRYGIGVEVVSDTQRLSHLKALFHAYIRPNEQMKAFLEAEYTKMIEPRHRVLGVLCRGTDYTLKRPKGHPVQPEPQEILEKASEVMTSLRCDKIYLATEDLDAYNLFKSHFGDALLANNYKKYSSNDFVGIEYISQIVTDQQKQQMEYLSSIYILSRCCCFIGGRTSGTIGVYLMKRGEFEYEYTWDKGSY